MGQDTRVDNNLVGFEGRGGEPEPAAPQQMHERLERPEALEGTTYKVKPPDHVSRDALYVTINDITLNQGTDFELRRPFEIFITSKNMDHFQWIVALTRIISAVFRKGGDCTFLVDELRSVFDPAGGYWKPGGKYVPSLVAEIGDVIERHLIKIGMLEAPRLDKHQRALIEQKREEFALSMTPSETHPDADADFPGEAEDCDQCGVRAVVVLDGDRTCLHCGTSSRG